MEINQEISLQQAIDLTTLFRTKRPDNYPLSEAFDIAAIKKLLSPGNVEFLRIYFGMKENNEVVCILVAADSEKNDLLPSAGQISSADATSYVILEDGFRCPQDCPKGSPLNGG